VCARVRARACARAVCQSSDLVKQHRGEEKACG